PAHAVVVGARDRQELRRLVALLEARGAAGEARVVDAGTLCEREAALAVGLRAVGELGVAVRDERAAGIGEAGQEAAVRPCRPPVRARVDAVGADAREERAVVPRRACPADRPWPARRLELLVVRP